MTAHARRISVVIPAFDAQTYLHEAITSVLEQTLAPYEVVVVDDGSTDATAEVARAFGDPVRYVRQSNAGAGAALNRGVRHARGDHLAFLDADDVWALDKLSLQDAVLDSRPTTSMVFGHVEQFHSPELTPDQRAAIALPEGIAPGLSKGTMLLSRHDFERVGPFATRWRLGDFVEWYARAVDAGLTTEVLPEVLLRRRLHPANSGLRNAAARPDYVRILKTVIDRRRTG